MRSRLQQRDVLLAFLQTELSPSFLQYQGWHVHPHMLSRLLSNSAFRLSDRCIPTWAAFTKSLSKSLSCGRALPPMDTT